VSPGAGASSSFYRAGPPIASALRWLAFAAPIDNTPAPANNDRQVAAQPEASSRRARYAMNLAECQSHTQEATMPKSRILIADDNPTNVELLEAYLAEMDCEIAVAADGRQTLEKVAEFQPDLILLDIMMPKLSGFEVCKKIKEDPATRHIMVLMVTALGELGDIERAVAAGCDDFLSKPINKYALVKRVENMLKLRHVTDELERIRRYIDGVEDASAPERRCG
jgi:CheY-like chemotaxis protein